MSKKGISTGTKTKVQQQFKDETNVNKIVSRFLSHGELPQGTSQMPIYMDHTDVEDFTEQLNRVTRVQQQFAQLKPSVRAKFQNDPSNLLAYLKDEKNIREGIELGLIKPTKELLHSLYSKEHKENSKKPTSTPEGTPEGEIEDSEKSTKSPKNGGAA